MALVWRLDRAGRNMIATSAEYKASIAKRTKRQTFAKVEINYTDPFVDSSLEVLDDVLMTEDGYLILTEDGFYIQEDPDLSNSMAKDQVADGIIYPTHNWFPLDGSGLLDGSFALSPPANDAINNLSMETGWWSRDVAGSGGTFAEAQVLVISHYERTVESLLVSADSIKLEYPVDFTIQLYDVDDNLLHTETVTANALTYWTKAITAVPGVIYQVLTITKWSHADRCAKIYEFFTAIKRTYYSKDILSMELLEERSADNASLPFGNISSNQFSLKLFNKGREFDFGSGSAISNLVKPMRKIIPYIGAHGASGEIEHVPLGAFWSQEWDVPDDDIFAETVALDLFSLMDKTDYSPGLLTNITLYDIIEAACQDFGMLAGSYWIDPTLDVEIIPYAYIDKTKHREAIRLAVEAGLATATMDRLGVLRIEGHDFMRLNNTESEKAISAAEYFTRKNPSRFSQICNVVNVNALPLSPDASPSLVYQNTQVVIPAGESVTVTAIYTDKPVLSASASLVSPPGGVSITGSTYYPWGADVTIHNSGGAEATVELDVSATVLRVSSGSKAQARDESSIAEFGELAYDFPDNPLIQSHAIAQEIADIILASYANARRDLSQEWRGDPALELGDRITTDDSRNSQNQYYIVRQSLAWDGTLRANHDCIAVSDFIIETEDGYLIEAEQFSYLLETE